MDQQDTFSESVSSLLERKVRSWLTRAIDDMRRSSPVQQWLDSLPAEAPSESDKSKEELNSGDSKDETKVATVIENSDLADDDLFCESSRDPANDDVFCESHGDNNLEVPRDMFKRKSLESGVLSSSLAQKGKKKLQRDYSVQSEGHSPRMKNPLFRDSSLQSDASGSSGSSILNVLGARKVDAESVLLALGFGPSEKKQKHQKIPDRFLGPSKLKGVSTEQFIKEEHHSMRMHDCGVFGYRGLTGNPHAPPSTIVAKIMERILQDDGGREREQSVKTRHSLADIRSLNAQERRAYITDT